MAVLEFLKNKAKDIDVKFDINNLKTDGYEINRLESGQLQIKADSPRSALWAVGQIKQGCEEGDFKPKFSVRGTNICESISRHTDSQLENFFDRMMHWRMNTAIIHLFYGYRKRKNLIDRLCAERGIDIIYYLQTALAFTSEADISTFAVDTNGNPRTTHACNETRLCPSNHKAKEAFRKGARKFFESEDAPAGAKFVLMDGDGYLFCQCEKCRKIKPVNQWAVFLEITIEEANRANKDFKLDYLSYVWRYARPENYQLFDNITGIMFDTHQRFRWAPINSDHPDSPYSKTEGEVDDRALEKPLNKYLYDRLFEWRENFSGNIYIFENLMIQGAISCPQPYTQNLLTDLQTYKSIGIDGIVYEAFEPGIESYTNQISLLSRAMWDEVVKYQPGRLEQLCMELNGDEVPFDFKNNFNVFSYIAVKDPDSIELMQQDGYDSVLIGYVKLLREFIKDRNLKNYYEITTYAKQHKDRLDWMMEGFNLIRAALRENPHEFKDEEIDEFINVNKLWDIQEEFSEPIASTEKIIDKILDKIENKN